MRYSLSFDFTLGGGGNSLIKNKLERKGGNL